MENKTGKYFKYAIGEIVLVVIGILIAVSINSKYQENENEKKIVAILEQIQTELLTDILDAKRIFDFNLNRSINTINIINNQISIEDLDNHDLLRIVYSYVSFSNNKTAYNRLINNLEILPKKYSELIPDLNYLYVEMQNDIDDYNLKIKTVSVDQFHNDLNTIPQLTDWLLQADKPEIKRHLLEDPYLKNKVTKYMNALKNITQASNDYRINAILVYKKIDSLIGTENHKKHNQLLTLNKNLDYYKDFLGNYVDEKGVVININIENDHLILEEKETQTRIVMWMHSKNTYFNEGFKRFIILNENENNEISMTEYKPIFSKTNYKKIK